MVPPEIQSNFGPKKVNMKWDYTQMVNYQEM